MAQIRGDFTGVILAGGRSRRFGSNKALVSWGKSTVLQTLGQTFQSLFARNLVVVKNQSDYPSDSTVGFRLVEDGFKKHHALGGIITALEAAPSENIFVSACDTPLIQPELIHVLCSRHGDSLATIPLWAGETQPLSAVYSKRALPYLKTAAIQGKLKLKEVLQILNPIWVSDAELRWAGINGWSFFDLDTRKDYEYAQKVFFHNISGR